MAVTLDQLTKGVTLASLAIAAYAAWVSLPLDAKLKQLQTESVETERRLKETETRLKDAEARLRETESVRKLTFDLYSEVKLVLANKGASERDENALRVLLETLAEDPFRSKLLDVLAAGARSASVKQLAEESSTFFKDEAQRTAALSPDAPPAPAAAPAPAGAAGIGNFDVDVFYCTTDRARQEALAMRIVALKTPAESGRWRPRLLPDSINQQPGYRVAETEIRYNAPTEEAVARQLKDRLAAAGIAARLRTTQTPTRWYVSVFACGGA